MKARALECDIDHRCGAFSLDDCSDKRHRLRLCQLDVACCWQLTLNSCLSLRMHCLLSTSCDIEMNNLLSSLVCLIACPPIVVAHVAAADCKVVCSLAQVS